MRGRRGGVSRLPGRPRASCGPAGRAVFERIPSTLRSSAAIVVLVVPARLQVRVIGPESGAATDITNGFTFYARVVGTGDTTALRELAGRLLDEQSGEGVPDTLAQDELDG